MRDVDRRNTARLSRRFHVALAAALAFVVPSVGCGPSSQEQKEAQAVDRVMHRPPPGWVRVLNLTKGKVRATGKNVVVATAVAPGLYSRLEPLGLAPQQNLTLDGPGGKITVAVPLTSDQGTTVVLYPDGKSTGAAPGSHRHPWSNNNMDFAFVSMISPSRTRPTFTLKASGKTVTVSPSDTEMSLSPGPCEVSGVGISSAKSDLVDQAAYTLLLLERSDGKVTPYFMANTDLARPKAVGAASS